MAGHNDLYPHISRALHDCVEIVHLEPQKDAISVRLVVTVADRPVIVVYFEAVQLQNQLPIRD
jgi:hypothetical protein